MLTADPLNRKVEKLKANVEHFRYLKAKTSNPQTTNFNDHYRSIFEKRNMYAVSKNGI